MATPEVLAKRFAAAVDRIHERLSRIEAKLGVVKKDPGPPIPLTHQEAKDRKKIKVLDEIADRLAAIEPKLVQPAPESRPAHPGDVRRANQSFRGDPAPPPLRKDR
jgi:hypothetical protein